MCPQVYQAIARGTGISVVMHDESRRSPQCRRHSRGGAEQLLRPARRQPSPVPRCRVVRRAARHRRIREQVNLILTKPRTGKESRPPGVGDVRRGEAITPVLRGVRDRVLVRHRDNMLRRVAVEVHKGLPIGDPRIARLACWPRPNADKTRAPPATVNHNGLAVPAAVPRADLSPVVQDDGPPQQSPGGCARLSAAAPDFTPASAGAIPCPTTEIPTPPPVPTSRRPCRPQPRPGTTAERREPLPPLRVPPYGVTANPRKLSYPDGLLVSEAAPAPGAAPNRGAVTMAGGTVRTVIGTLTAGTEPTFTRPGPAVPPRSVFRRRPSSCGIAATPRRVLPRPRQSLQRRGTPARPRSPVQQC